MTKHDAIHVPIAGLALLPVLFGLPPLLLPAHVVLTEMIIDPACSFAFEGIAEERGIMQRPPRPAREALLGRATVWRGLAEGGVPNCVLHPMGVEANLFSPDRRDPAVRARLLEMCDLPESAHLLMGVGRLSAEKRWPMVIDAVTAASQRHPIGLVLLGAGSQRARILKRIAGNPHIRLLTPERNRQRFATLLASADAVVHGCEAETFCLAAAEARASGVPVIVPDRGGAADHASGGAGLTYRANNPLALADAIEREVLSPIHPPRHTPITMRDHFATLFEIGRAHV